MKAFESLIFDPAQCRQEVAELRLAHQNPILDEKRQILPFFLSASALGVRRLHGQDLKDYDRIAFSIRSSAISPAISLSATRAKCIFHRVRGCRADELVHPGGKRATGDGRRLQHECSQIIDWYYKVMA
jgi:hypothetical protein